MTDYTNEYLVNCIEKLSEAEADKKLIIHQIDRYVFVTVGFMALFATLFIIITYAKVKEARTSPADLMLGISIAEFCLCVHWITSSFYMIIEGGAPESHSKFCQGNAYVSVPAGAAEFLYNLAFCVYLLVTFRSELRSKTIKQYWYHVVCISLSLIFLIAIIAMDKIGLSLFGTCSMRVTDAGGFIGVGIFFVYFIFAIYTIVRFKKVAPEHDPEISELRQEILQYFYPYVKSSCVIWGVLALSNLIAQLNCTTFHRPWLLFFLTVGNVAKISTPFVLSILRYREPTIKQSTRAFIQTIPLLRRLVQPNELEGQDDNDEHSQQQQQKMQQQLQLQQQQQLNQHLLTEQQKQYEERTQHFPNQQSQDSTVTPSLTNKLLDGDKTPYAIEKPNRNTELSQSKLSDASLPQVIVAPQLNINTLSKAQPQSKQNIYSKMQKRLKVMNISTVISSILMANTKYHKHYCLEQVTETDCEHSEKFVLSQQSLREQLQMTNDEIKVNSCTVTVYAPNVFNAFITIDKLMVDIQSSLSLEKNFENIQKDAEKSSSGDGGRSGEFFFFSSDKRLIIKTLKREELDTLRRIMRDQVEHFKDNAESMIAKFYGVYSIEYANSDSQVHLFVTRNISQAPSEYITRTFDLKGSTHDRQVVKDTADSAQAGAANGGGGLASSGPLPMSTRQRLSSVPELTEQRLTKNTLKDLDFEKHEKRVNIDRQRAAQCQAALEKDARFFQRHNLMDYSLLIVKVNWDKYCAENACAYAAVRARFSQDLHIIPNDQEPGTYYHMAIIDYLQEWNTQKMVEKNAKQVINMHKPKLNVSAQNPVKYAERFINEVVYKIFGVPVFTETI